MPIIQQEISDIDLVKIINNNHDYAKKYKIEEDFIERNISYLNMESICQYQDLSIEFIERNHNFIKFDKLNETILKKADISFYEKWSDKLNWNYISLIHRDFNLKNEIEFVDKFQDKLNWNYISYMDLTDEFITKFKNKLNWDVLNIDFDALREKSKQSGEKLESTSTQNHTIADWKDILKGSNLEGVISKPVVEGEWDLSKFEKQNENTTYKKDPDSINLMKVDNLYVDGEGQLHAKIGDKIVKIKLG